MLKVAVLVSGGGSNLQSILDYENKNYQVEMVIGSKEGIYGLERAKNAGVETFVVSKKEYGSEVSNKILELTKGKVDLIVLAGYLSILDGEILREFKNRIINIHPSLIPSFCGDKMYGMHVHEAVLQRGAKVSGATVHFVSNIVDGGPIIKQVACDISDLDTADDIQKRVLEIEHKLLPEVVGLYCDNKIKIIDGKAKVI